MNGECFGERILLGSRYIRGGSGEDGKKKNRRIEWSVWTPGRWRATMGVGGCDGRGRNQGDSGCHGVALRRVARASVGDDGSLGDDSSLWAAMPPG